MLGDIEVTSSCHETVDLEKLLNITGLVSGPDGKPLEGIGLWAWQGERSNSGSGVTKSHGRFQIRVPKGSFTLDVYRDLEAGCTFVGWYDGADGLATASNLAAKVVVEDASVEGIKITLPASPKDLPLVAWCAE